MRDYSRELEFIQTIKKFGEEEYGLNFKGAFEDVDLGEFSCNWAYACPVDKLESVFNNKRPYEFYPDQDKAWKRYMQLKNAGNDSYFYHAEAHGEETARLPEICWRLPEQDNAMSSSMKPGIQHPRLRNSNIPILLRNLREEL